MHLRSILSNKKQNVLIFGIAWIELRDIEVCAMHHTLCCLFLSSEPNQAGQFIPQEVEINKQGC